MLLHDLCVRPYLSLIFLSGSTLKDSRAFVFSLKNSQNTKPFLKLSTGGFVKLGSIQGPGFGKMKKSKFTAEFMIDDYESVSSVSGGFKLSSNCATVDKDLDNINLAGSEKFSVDNMEVFSIEDIDSDSNDSEDNDDQLSSCSDWY